jgi:hypothetical protein
MDTIADEVADRTEFKNRRADKITDNSEYWSVKLVLTTSGKLRLYINFGGEEKIECYDFSEKDEALYQYKKIKRKYDLTE